LTELLSLVVSELLAFPRAVPVNFLEQLVSEWYEFQGYFVRRNVSVGVLPGGGYEGELDVVALHPGEKRLLHIEPSMDAYSWEEREKRFANKFAIGQKYIPTLFTGFPVLPTIEPIALIGFGTAPGRSTLGGGKLIMIGTLMEEIRTDLKNRNIHRAAVPEQYLILRTLQFAAHYWRGAAC
jgi:hypothetical protein